MQHEISGRERERGTGGGIERLGTCERRLWNFHLLCQSRVVFYNLSLNGHFFVFCFPNKIADSCCVCHVRVSSFTTFHSPYCLPGSNKGSGSLLIQGAECGEKPVSRLE